MATEIQSALEGYEFLRETFSQKRLQREARNILDSYSHTWDLLAEALQNSVDAIEQSAKSTTEAVKQIQIVFDAHLRSIEVSDTGIGMSADQVMSVLAPHQGFKRGMGLRGEKGVGLSFIMFMSNRFRIETCDGKQTVGLAVHRANDWANGTDDNPLKFTNVKVTAPQEFLGSPTYTRIWAEQIPPAKDFSEDIFEYTKPQLVYVLRTKTAVGNTHPLFNVAALPPVDITVQLAYVDSSGKQSKREDVPYSFQAPHAFLKPKEVLSWDELVIV